MVFVSIGILHVTDSPESLERPEDSAEFKFETSACVVGVAGTSRAAR